MPVASARSRTAARCSRSRSRRYSRTSPACTAKPSSTRRSVARSGWPRRASTCRSSTRTLLSASSGVTSGAGPLAASDPPARVRPWRAARRPLARTSRAAASTTACAVSCPVSTDWASEARVAASVARPGGVGGPARRAVHDRRHGHRNRDVHQQRERGSSARAIVNRPTGGVKNQLRSRKPPSAASSAGNRPPTRATSDGRGEEQQDRQRQLPRVVQPEQHGGQGGRRDQRERPAGELPAPAQRRQPGSQAQPGGGLVVGDQVDVDRAGEGRDPVAGGAGEETAQAAVSRDADHHHRRVGAARRSPRRPGPRPRRRPCGRCRRGR